MKPDPKAEPRCAECEEHVYLATNPSDGLPDGPRYCGCFHNPEDPEEIKRCTQDDGPAPDWCPRRRR